MALQPAPGAAAATDGMEVAVAPSSPAIRRPENALPAAAPPTGTPADLRNAPSSSAFTQQMARSEPPPAQIAAAESVKNISAAAAPAASARLAENAPADRKKFQSLSSQVLASFQIQRTGQQVRIVEADGSDYEGQVVEPALLERMQAAAQENWLALNGAGVPSGAANAAQQGFSNGNFQAQGNGYANAQLYAGELPPRPANEANAAQNQVSSLNAAEAKMAGSQLAGDGGGFAFQVSGSNRTLRQSVTIIGNCINVPPPPSGPQTAGNLSNQLQTPAGANVAVANSRVAAAAPPASQFQNGLENNSLNYKSNQNLQNTALAGQFWRVTGQVQIGPTNYFDLDAATVQP
jgi:hypothetical protein